MAGTQQRPQGARQQLEVAFLNAQIGIPKNLAWHATICRHHHDWDIRACAPQGGENIGWATRFNMTVHDNCIYQV